MGDTPIRLDGGGGKSPPNPPALESDATQKSRGLLLAVVEASLPQVKASSDVFENLQEAGGMSVGSFIALNKGVSVAMNSLVYDTLDPADTEMTAACRSALKAVEYASQFRNMDAVRSAVMGFHTLLDSQPHGLPQAASTTEAAGLKTTYDALAGLDLNPVVSVDPIMLFGRARMVRDQAASIMVPALIQAHKQLGELKDGAFGRYLLNRIRELVGVLQGPLAVDDPATNMAEVVFTQQMALSIQSAIAAVAPSVVAKAV